MPSENDGVMIVLSSPSGAGKTTLVKMLSKMDNYEISISHTTRQPRHNEKNNKDYYFVNKIKPREVEYSASMTSFRDSGDPWQVPSVLNENWLAAGRRMNCCHIHILNMEVGELGNMNARTLEKQTHQYSGGGYI